MKYNVISADNHILEPRDLFVTRMPQAFRDRAPRVMTAVDGGDGWSLDGRPPPRSFGLEATAGRPTQAAGYKWEDILPGNYDANAHIKDMLDDGVDAAVVFPTIGLNAYNLPADDFSLAILQTYNEWLMSDFVGADPRRLIGLPLVPVNHGPEIAVAEVKRRLAQGARGFFLPAYPNTSYLDPMYEPLWATFAEAGVPACFHRQNGGTDPAGNFDADYKSPGLGPAGTVIRFFSAIPIITKFIFTGLFERHPKLKIMCAEVDFGWIPYWKFQMDHTYAQQKNWANFPFDRLPSDYIGKNFFVTVLDDQVGFDAVSHDPQMAEVALFSIDYPHSVCLWPNSAAHIDRVTKNVDPVAKHKILAGNAQRLFQLN